jgi:hypothetical protein
MHFDKIFQTIRFGVNAERFCYGRNMLPNTNFNKIAPDLTLEIRKKHLNSPLKQTINIRQVNIWKEVAVGDYGFSPVVYQYDTMNISIYDLTYTIDNSRKINPYSIVAQVEKGDVYLKTSLTANYSITLKKKKKSVDLRGYFGHMTLSDPGTSAYFNGNYYFHASGGNGPQDYLYDNVFLGRSEHDGFLSHQFTETEGALKAYTPLGRSSDWLAAFNIKSSVPGKLPVRLFADFSFVPKAAALSQTTLYDAGIYIPLVRNIIEIYCPILVSKDIRDVFYLNNPDLVDINHLNDPDPKPFKRMIRMVRFTFNIHKMNPFGIVRNLSL